MDYLEQIKHAKAYMYQFHKNDTTGHDVAHVERVLHLARYISDSEQIGSKIIIELASLLHDTVDDKLTNQSEGLVALTNFLQQLQLTSHQQQHILHIIKHMSYKDGKNNAVQLSIEGQIVRDADRLDALGAIGIARTFQFAGHFGEPMWQTSTIDTNVEKAQQIPHTNDIMHSPPSAIKHFYDKLFKLKDLMHTTTAKKLAEERHIYMENFVKQFFQEWYF
ncbi:phosphohydrolase [Staphylococcus gallinarum]|uniref:HD domain-containing protein n=1 Tax=Staphylococcus gallinarum TaxID=1293 RepID=UPI000D1E8A01|nr:HD domain-containing protein [Staphylococcus gallinarum]MCD8860112.1 HD domain-containing protein [Staphylococcus gallinarum]PTK88394.1 phosphohydrolase [Staphylococcus gallinarum]PTK93169.1 phosphohydrolase [Staphylococcus gallinarum]PTL18063.1 phosphohydrolase [Staphylococcus gallinarum]RIO78796.1 HD domain-containing protein [Staphylococcus gallinarum]